MITRKFCISRLEVEFWEGAEAYCLNSTEFGAVLVITTAIYGGVGKLRKLRKISPNYIKKL